MFFGALIAFASKCLAANALGRIATRQRSASHDEFSSTITANIPHRIFGVEGVGEARNGQASKSAACDVDTGAHAYHTSMRVAHG